ncbi:MAG: DivIVA domain-containing protein [Blastococcus sp.]
MPQVTGAALRATRLGRPGWGRRGYDPAQVDAFLARAADALEAPADGRVAGVTADEVCSVVFTKPGLGRGRGYDEDEVDALLDAVEATLRGGSGARGVPELNGRPLTE